MDDRSVRQATFAWLDEQTGVHGYSLDRTLLAKGFEFQGEHIRLVGRRVGDFLVALDWWIQEAGSEEEASRYRDERRVSMAAVVSQIGLRGEFMYRYDMGDGWEHRIVIEFPPASTISNPRLPVCIAGENACPPEDVGGPHGYELFLDILGDRDHEQYEETVRWAGGVFDPKGFDLNRLNRDRKGPRRSRRA
jgi:hypothetical protein